MRRRRRSLLFKRVDVYSASGVLTVVCVRYKTIVVRTLHGREWS